MADLRVEKGSITKNRIISSSLEIIGEEGIKSLSASKIALKSGISKSNVFHHFKSVQKISLEVFDYIGMVINEQLKSLTHSSFSEYLDNLGHITFKESKNTLLFKTMLSFYQAALYSEEYREGVLVCTTAIAEDVLRVLSEYYTIDRCRAKKLSFLIVTTIDGLGMHYLINPLADFEESWNSFKEIVLKSLE